MLVQIFNVSQSLLPYLVKVFCIVDSVVSLFVGIHMLGRDHFAVAFGIFTGSYAVFGFIVIFDEAFKIPLAVDRLKNTVLLMKCLEEIHSVENGGDADSMVIEDMDSVQSPLECVLKDDKSSVTNGKNPAGGDLNRFLKSVPQLAIKVSSFTTLERDSTPDFLSFVTQQVFSLLIAFQE